MCIIFLNTHRKAGLKKLGNLKTRQKTYLKIIAGLVFISALGGYYHLNDMFFGVILCLVCDAVLLMQLYNLRAEYRYIDKAREDISQHVEEQSRHLPTVFEQIQHTNSPLPETLQVDLINIIEGLHQLMESTPTDEREQSHHTYAVLIDKSEIFRKHVLEQNIEVYFEYADQLCGYVACAAKVNTLLKKASSTNDPEALKDAYKCRKKLHQMSFSPKSLPHY
jgi:hypothetical protein